MTRSSQDSSVQNPQVGGSDSSYRITHERGPMTRQIRTAALAWGGETAWETLLASVSPACRSRFQIPIGFYEWVESVLAVELHEAWVRQQGLENMSQRGEDAAREILGGVQQWILRFASPAFLLENISRIFGFYYRGGCLSLTLLRPGLAEFELRAIGYPDSWFHEGLPAWMKVSLEMTGVQGVTVNHFPPDPETEPYLHRYEVGWRS